MIDLVLAKKAVLHYVQDVKGGRGLSDHHVILHKVRLVGAWIMRRKVVNESRRLRSEKLREHQHMIVFLKVRD